MHRPLPAFLICSMLLAAFLTGCRGSATPEFAANGAHVAQSSDAGTVVEIEIRTINRTEYPLPLTRVEYTVEIDGKPAASGTRSAQCTAHRFAEQVFSLPAVIPGNVKPSTYRVNGTVTYVPASLIQRVFYDEGIHRPSESFSFSGDIDPGIPVVPVRRAPELTMPAPRPGAEKKSPDAAK